MSLALRVRSPAGVSTIKLDGAASARDLVDEIGKVTGLAVGSFEVRAGSPPKLVDLSDPSASLSALGVRAGDTVMVASSTSEPAPAPAPAKPAPAPVAAPAPSKPQRSNGINKLPKTVSTRFGDGFICLRQVPDDNSCMFHAASLVLTPGQRDGASRLRKVVTDTIQADPVEFGDAILGQAPAEYCARMLKPTTWGGAIELAALSQAFQTEIASVDVQTGRIDRFGEGRYSSRVLLAYSGIHYDALTQSPIADSDAHFPYNDDALAFDLVSFDASDDSVLIAAQEIANQLRAAHAYTDTASFTLKCGQCGTGLKGEREARQRAQGRKILGLTRADAAETTHTAFTEYA